MKRVACFWLGSAIVMAVMIGSAWGQAQQDSLAEYARQKRMQKQSEPAPKRVFDNDNLPKAEHISVVGTASKEASPDAQPTEKASNGDKAAPAEPPKDAEAVADKADPSKTKLDATAGQPAEDRQKASDDWKKKIADQKATVDLESRELDVMQREYRLRAAAVYGDAGTRLRNAATWDKEDKQYKDQIAAKQKAVDTAKQQLADLQDKARKAGIPSKERE
jgi:hypothetical protein